MATLQLDPATLNAMRQLLQGKNRKWATPGDMAQHLDPDTIQTPALRLIDQTLIDTTNTTDGRAIITLPPQEGKALAPDTPIATPHGWTTIGNLKPGDIVYDRTGNPCHVTWVSPTWHNRPRYKVHTRDGETIIADARHEWVAKLDARSPYKTHETTVIAKPRCKHAQTPTAAPLNSPSATLPIDPYVLGAWLGDGTTRGASITTHPDDGEILDRIRKAGYPTIASKTHQYLWSLSDTPSGRCSTLRRQLTQIGVWGNKHIPNEYKRASYSQRLALMQGLIDTDGHVLAKGQIEFTSTSRRLASDVYELAWTLGVKATIRTGKATLNGKDCGAKYRVRFYLKDAAHLTRKRNRCKNSSVADRRYMWATATTPGDTICIEVDSPDHTFLAGRSLLPTHNSQRVSRRYPLWTLTHNPNTRIAIVSYSHAVARRWGRTIRDDITTHPDLGLTIRPDLSAQHEWQLAGAQGGVYTTGIGGSLTGRPVDLLIIDDPIKDREQADSTIYRNRVWDWWTDVASTRLAPGAPVILILTRWHQDDLAGRLLNAPDGHRWKLLNIPAQAETSNDPLGRKPGEWLQSSRRRTTKQWEAIKQQAGSRTFNSLYQGHPSPPGGTIFNRDHWIIDPHPTWQADNNQQHWVPSGQVFTSWDLTFKSGEHTDWVVGQVWQHDGAVLRLLDQARGRWSFTATCQHMQQLAARWPQATAHLVEDKANGPAVIDALHHTLPGLVPVQPQGGKESRANVVQPLVEAGNVHLPGYEPWCDDLIEECAGFPNATHDDQVDALTQALTWATITRRRKGNTFTPLG